MKLSVVAQSNKGVSLTGERVVVVGGTQGIGGGVACRFAEAGAEVWIVGRNETKANEILEKMKASSAELEIDPPPEHAFLKGDLTLVSDAKRIAQEIHSRAGSNGIDYLVMSQGGPSNGTYIPTSEGYEQHYAVQVLSRFVIAHKLAGDPTSSTVRKGVMSIMSPGRFFGQSFDTDDIHLVKARAEGRYGILKAAGRNSVVVDAFTDDLVKANPDVTFTHVYPGAVKTDFARNSNLAWYFKFITDFFFFFAGTTPQHYAEIPLYLLAHPEGRTIAKRDTFIDEKVRKVGQHANFGDSTVRDKIRSHLSGVLSL